MARNPSVFVWLTFFSVTLNYAVIGQELPRELVEMKSRMEEQWLFASQLALLKTDKALANEISVVDDQVAEIDSIVEMLNSNLQEFVSANQDRIARIEQLGRDRNEPEAVTRLGKELFEAFEGQLKSTKDHVNEVFLPHQLKRLREVFYQRKAVSNNRFGSQFGIPIGLATELGLTNTERDELSRLTDEVTRDYLEKVERLRRVGNEKLIKSLNNEQQAKLRSMVGDYFDSEIENSRLNAKKRD